MLRPIARVSKVPWRSVIELITKAPCGPGSWAHSSEAYLYAYEGSDQAVSFCGELLRGLEKEFSTCCLGSLTEVFDGDPPHLPGGCPSQLWSVAQFLIARERLGHFSRD